MRFAFISDHAAFGATAGAVSGTTVKFNAPTGTDTMVKNNTQQHINTRFMCIVTMKEYETKSLEELRMEDYAANRKGASPKTRGTRDTLSSVHEGCGWVLGDVIM